MKVELIPALKDNYVYLLYEKIGGPATVIDPSEANPVLEKLDELSLSLNKILNTHHHFDHIGGNEELVKKTGAHVYCSTYDLNRIPEAQSGLKDGDHIDLLGESANILEIPGHTMGHIAFWLAKSKLIFCGDTLFSLGCGRVFEGSLELLWKSLHHLAALPEDTMVYCGHEYTEANLKFVKSLGDESVELSTFEVDLAAKRNLGRPSLPSSIKTEKTLNPFLRAKNLADFSRLRIQKDSFGA
ncbi:MAG: hydroxyacylglutathione hydrolase [Deltaproteobacteria bacterium CG11_big_fil_rev_8_21_14_0_20_45_16]|nr:MAG: hydroxyacylglutathione hydrolase [Deltaproteobacteria bacterium CG11_big_fil_rev_8_21_14_0_20_45_16]